LGGFWKFGGGGEIEGVESGCGVGVVGEVDGSGEEGWEIGILIF
jgi:hypothetical protein